MSEALRDYVIRFVRGELSADVFADQYIDKWRAERDAGIVLTDDPELSECLSSIFCIADLHNPEQDREVYELDESQLRAEIRKVLKL